MKSKNWIKGKYFARIGLKDWCFYAKAAKEKERPLLKSASNTRIFRHVKIKAAANPYDPIYKEYFLQRNKQQQMRQRIYSRAKPFSFRRA